MATLSHPPKVELEIAEEGAVGEPFLEVRRLRIVTVPEHGPKSAPFRYDVLDRRALDAAVIVAHYLDGGRPHVYLRSSVRPPLVLRPRASRMSPSLWEVPAGLIEPDERPAAGAARELQEELGFEVSEEAMQPLGPRALPAPGFIGELHFYFHVRVDPRARREPAGDGSALERDARIVTVPLDEALDACRRGDIPDAKTELSLRRLAEMLGT